MTTNPDWDDYVHHWQRYGISGREIPTIPFQCPICDGVGWFKRWHMCHGTATAPHRPAKMRAVDAAPDVYATDGLVAK